MALIGRQEIPGGLIAPHAGRTAASRTLRMKRLVYVWIATAVVLLVSIGEATAQPKSGETAAQPKTVHVPSFIWRRISAPGAHGARKSAKNWADSRLGRWKFKNIPSLRLRVATALLRPNLLNILRRSTLQRPPDLIVAFGGPAARFVQRHRADLYPTTPMLLAAVELRRVERSMLSEQDAAVAVRFDQVALVENILRLLPETKAIAMIIGNSPHERFWIGEQKRVLGPLLENKVELIFFNERPFEEILKEVASLPPHSAILLSAAIGTDGAGAIYGDKEQLKRIYEVANAAYFFARPVLL